MEFHLNYTPAPSPVKITHADKILLIGSCFAESIGEKLTQSKFDCLINPNGILFNPASISTALRSYIQPETRNSKPPHSGALGKTRNNSYFSFEHHGSFSSSTKEELENKITAAHKTAHQQLKEAKFLIITFGSAFAYRHITSDKIVANCHKLPQQEFKKELLSAENIVANYKLLFEELKTFNPKLNIILTVSPVKYLRDGIIENNLSKAILLQSVHQLTTASCQLQLPLPTATAATNRLYFPAYELVADDLRDYRFYKEDMAHPNDQAINYVWEKFSECYFSEETKQLTKKINEITKAVSHRPIHQNSEAHQKLKTTYIAKCEQLEKEFPYINMDKQKNLLQS